ncbi:MAG: hypothetical protein KAJ03_03750 [Gammaproteobacteria bacterium]|nr:hypothetical protein [Gammaproteobacteria bacterium]
MARVRFESTVLSVAGDHSGIRLRGSGSGGSENAYNLLFNDNHTLKITKFVSGTQTQLDSDTTLALLPERWYLMRFRVNGTSLEGSIWIETEKEPVSPQVTATDSAITAAGWVGFGGDGHFVDNDIDWVSISFAGAVSSPPAIPAQARVSTNFLEVLSAGAAEARVSTSFLEAVVTDPAEARVSASFLEVVIAPVVASATTQVLQILKVPPSTLKVSQQIIQALVIQDPAPNVTMQVLQILHGTNVQPPSQSSSANISVDVNT